jgi:VCBS repeat-containing protein
VGATRATDGDDADTKDITLVFDAETSTVTYDPGTVFWDLKAGETATDDFEITIKDEDGATATGRVVVGIQGLGGRQPDDTSAPVFKEGSTASLVVDEDPPGGVAIDPLLIVFDDDAGQNFRWTLATEPDSGTVSPLPVMNVDDDGASRPPSITYTPDLDFVGEDVFTVSVTDGVSTDTLSIAVTVNPINDAPRFVAGESVTLTVKEDGEPLDLADALRVVEPEAGDVATWSLNEAPSFGSISGLAGAQATADTKGSELVPPDTVLYTPEPNADGTDRFTVTASDGRAESTLEVRVDITPINDAPITVEDRVRANEDEAVLVDFLGNDKDIEGTELSFVEFLDAKTETAMVGGKTEETFIFASGARGQLRDDGKFVYDPQGAFDALRRGEETTDTLTYVVADAGGAESTGTVLVTVVGENDDPIFSGDQLIAVETGRSAAIGNSDLFVTDPDNANPEVTLSVISASNGFLARTDAPQTPIGAFAPDVLNGGNLLFTITGNPTEGGTFALEAVDTEGGRTAVTVEVLGFGEVPPMDLAVPIFAFARSEVPGVFLTASPAERDIVAANLATFDDAALADFLALPADAVGEGGSVPVFRLFNTSTNTHFYTTSQAELDFIRNIGLPYRLEGAEFAAFEEARQDTVAVQRYYDPESGTHLFLTEEQAASFDLPETAQLEGIAFHVFPEEEAEGAREVDWAGDALM